MKRFLKKLTGYRKGGYTNPLAQDYEPAGVIHHGKFEITMNGTLYEGIGHPNGFYDLYIDGSYYASYPQHVITKRIIDHAKGQKQ